MALQQAIRGDLVRWLQICGLAAEQGRAAGHPAGGIRWWDVAGELSLHMPLGLYLQAFWLYVEREQTEHAYALSLTPEGVTDPEVAYSIRFGLRKWAAMAERYLELWDEYENRPRWKRMWHRLRKPLLERGGKDAVALMALIRDPVVKTLRCKYGYEVTDDGELVPDIARSERHQRAQEEFLAGYSPTSDGE